MTALVSCWRCQGCGEAALLAWERPRAAGGASHAHRARPARISIRRRPPCVIITLPVISIMRRRPKCAMTTLPAQDWTRPSVRGGTRYNWFGSPGSFFLAGCEGSEAETAPGPMRTCGQPGLELVPPLKRPQGWRAWKRRMHGRCPGCPRGARWCRRRAGKVRRPALLWRLGV